MKTKKIQKLFIWILLLIIYYLSLNTWNVTFLDDHNIGILSDLETVSQIASDHGMFIYLLHQEILSSIVNGGWSYGSRINQTPVLLGLDSRILNAVKLREFLNSLEGALFKTLTFFNLKPLIKSEIGNNCPVGFVIKRNTTLYFIILYSREDIWWFGSLKSDEKFNSKINFFNFSNSFLLNALTQEGALDKFEGLMMKINRIHSNIVYPKNILKFLNDFQNSRFIECNVTRANNFKKLYRYNTSIQAKKFKHRARKLLAVTKVVLDNLSIPFWISSGTCLGYLRECDIISYSQDVDIGVFVKDFNYQIISDLNAHNINLKHWFGELEDSLELSFIDMTSGIKLDIFFFYPEGNTYWNGGTQLRTGTKFKYIFKKFDLCWTLFLGLKLRVPCDTESYIFSNYGPNWTRPIKKWDWKSSPPNVKNNGVWPKNKWPSVIRTW